MSTILAERLPGLPSSWHCLLTLNSCCYLQYIILCGCISPIQPHPSVCCVCVSVCVYVWPMCKHFLSFARCAATTEQERSIHNGHVLTWCGQPCGISVMRLSQQSQLFLISSITETQIFAICSSLSLRHWSDLSQHECKGIKKKEIINRVVFSFNPCCMLSLSTGARLASPLTASCTFLADKQSASPELCLPSESVRLRRSDSSCKLILELSQLVCKKTRSLGCGPIYLIRSSWIKNGW